MSQGRKVATDTGLNTLVSCEIQRSLPGGDQLNQHCVNSFGKGLNVTDGRSFIWKKQTTLKIPTIKQKQNYQKYN